MRPNAPGPTALRVWLAKVDMSAKELAAKLRITHGAALKYKRGYGRPNGYTAMELERLSEGAVGASLWLE